AAAGKRVPPPAECPTTAPRNLDMYTRAAAAYDAYLGGFPDGAHAQEVRFLRADILFFKMTKHEAAGDEYLAVGKSSPVGKFHKDALLQAMRAFECARPRNVVGKRELLPVDRKFAAAVDLFATLFQGDDTLVGVVFRNGQLFYDYGDYGEAVKRFGLIVTKYPDHPDAGPAGDRILNALIKSQDYETVEEWARKLKKAKAFQNPDKQADLDRMIVESIVNSGKKYADAGKYDQAAKFYLRVAKEYRDHELAAPSLFEAANMFRKAKRPETAGSTYLAVTDSYPKHKLAGTAAFEAGKVYEQMAYYDRAAEAYEVVVTRFIDKDKDAGADALYNAGVLRQALGQNGKAIAHFELYAKKFRNRKDAAEVAFRIGLVHEQAKDDGRAERAYRDYIARFHPDTVRLIEAHTRAGRAALSLGQLKRAAGDFDTALKLYGKMPAKDRAPATKWAAECRYHQGELVHREYQKIGLDVKMNKLKATLEKKKDLLAKAKGIYEEVVAFGDLQWAAAALYRRGAIFEEFAKAMREAPDPPGVSDDVIEQYHQALEDQVVKIEKIAVDRYQEGYQKVIELKVYNNYTRMMREALGRLASSEYPPSAEERAHVRIGDRPPAPKLVEEVIRE
ncbi:MAG TPA: tetratricopeptide repeat protein, partial [Kofleriaceae bacterium]|nr:tetratricopeptide repeat protein [Kofleriaceae bacterium]